jgi:hypothetical protein
MQLNESTYETTFLLYIDNELSPKERLEVEAFIADNPSYALEMEALQATVLSSEKIQYPFKENLKEQAEISLDGMEENWNATYATMLKADVEAIPGLSTSFKNSLKKETSSEAIIVKSFGFNQQKFTYAAVAACFMAFFGYQQLTKIEAIPSAASALVETDIRNNAPKADVEIISTNTRTKQSIKKIQEVTTKLEASNSSKMQGINVIQQESIAMAETTSNIESLNNQAVSTKLPSNFNNPININATPLPISSANLDTEPTEVEKVLPNYETIDTEDPSRTIFIANFEIDGAAFRGITRRVSALLKRNKSEKEK